MIQALFMVTLQLAARPDLAALCDHPPRRSAR